MKTGPVPTPPPKNEGEYARKLALAILSTLEQKGILSRFDVDTILQAAHRAAQSASPLGSIPAPPPQVQITLAPTAPAPLGTRWVKPADSEAKGEAPAPKRTPEKSDTEKSEIEKGEAKSAARSPQAVILPPPEETEHVAADGAEVRPANKKTPKPATEKQPLVIDFTLD